MPTDRKPVTRAYINDKKTQIILRTAGSDVIVPLLRDDGKPHITTERVGDLVLEAIARLLLQAHTVDDIASGKAIPDRTLPKVKEAKAPPKLNRARQAIANVWLRDTLKASGARKADAELTTAADAFARGLTEAEVKSAAKTQRVLLEIARLTGADDTPLEQAIARAAVQQQKSESEPDDTAPGETDLAAAAD